MKGTIFIIDDSLVIRETLENFLKKADYDVYSMESGVAFFSTLKTMKPDLIILDKILPDKDGFDILKYLKMHNEYNDIPIILFTTQDNFDNEMQGLKLGAEMFLSKSTKLEEMLLYIDAIIKKQKKWKKIKNNINELSKELTEKKKKIKKISEQSRILNDKINNLTYDIINVLLKTLEVKDSYTKRHSENVAKFSEIIAKEMNFDNTIIENVRLAGFFHDIGKIGIPDYILNSTKKLTDDERKIIQKHPVIGANILESVKSLKHLAPIVMYHHENFDGSGYPEGIKAEEIPIESRIIRIVDFFDAVSSDRIYRPAYSFEESIKIMDENKNFFDPKIYKVFLNMVNSFAK